MKTILEDRFEHPIFKPLWLQFTTPSVKQLHQKLKQWIYCGITGGVIVGDARIGKTTAIEILHNRYTTRSKGQRIHCHRFVVPKRDTPTIANCLRALYFSAEFTLGKTKKADEMSEQLVHYFLDLACENDDKVVLLIVDEFHRLSINQIEVFAELHDKLRLLNASLHVYLMGNANEAEKLIGASERTEYAHLRGRFFNQKYYFSGIQNINDLKQCLRMYDVTRYPEETGPTYTEYFLPADFKKGWRLEQQAKLIWECYSTHRNELSINSWGMKYFVGTVSPLLTDYLPQYSTAQLSRNMVEKCIEVSGLIPDYVRAT
ncbi:hypothetical protein NBRC116493_35360 [Aurantivibrio infirmus]